MLLQSGRIGVRHGFSTREGGVSEGPFASLNLGRSVGDDLQRVEENARRLAQAAGLRAGQFVSANQVHGVRLLEVESAPGGDQLPAALADADGLFTNAPGVAVGVRTADCVPVLLHAPDVGAVAAVHSGWRGTLESIGRLAVERLAERYGARPERMTAGIGPCIRGCCYEVDAPLAARFTARFGPTAARDAGGGKAHLDLVEACRRALLEAGVGEDAIDVLPHCTCCDARRFFSHRREQGKTGRHWSFIVL